MKLSQKKYKNIKNFTNLQTQKINKNDINYNKIYKNVKQNKKCLKIIIKYKKNIFFKTLTEIKLVQSTI